MILLVTAENEEVLRAQFGRYAAEYAVRVSPSLEEGVDLIRRAEEEGTPLALMVLDTTLPTPSLKHGVVALIHEHLARTD